jgi:hypothetical protein
MSEQGIGILNIQCKLLLRTLVCCLLAMRALAQQASAQEGGQGQAERHHPPQDQLLHERFYSTWHMPDNPALSCCNNADCYPTDVKFESGRIYARRREDGKYILIPPEKLERRRDNPDGRNHLCAPPPNGSNVDRVFCFSLGGAT